MRVGTGVAALAVIAILAGVWWHYRPSPTAPRVDAAAASVTAFGRVDPASPAVSAGSRASSSLSAAELDRRVEDSLRLKIGDEGYAPKTPEELAWRLRHCYGSIAQMQMANDRIRARQPLQTGNLCSPVSINHAGYLAMTSADQRDAALAYLEASATAGSMRALEELSGVYGYPGGKGMRDPVMSEAYARVAISRGDWVLAVLNVRQPLNYQESMLSDLYAQRIIQQMNLARQRGGLPPLGYDPQPGLPDPDRMRAEYDAMVSQFGRPARKK